MKTSIPWLRVLAEGLVIVVSILLAFGIDAWWDDRNAALAERALLGDVVEELGQIVEVLDAAGAIHVVHRQAAQTRVRHRTGRSRGCAPSEIGRACCATWTR